MLFLVHDIDHWSIIVGPAIPAKGKHIIPLPETDGTRRFEELLHALPGDRSSILGTIAELVNAVCRNGEPSS